MSELLKELFVLNPETQLVDINKPWLSTIKEFKVLLKRDKGTVNGNERRKLRAEKEFTFIYHLVDYRSSFADFSEEERLASALANSDFDPKFDYQKDEALAAAVEVYKALRDTPGLLMLYELKQGIHSSQRVVKKIRQNLNKLLDELDLMSEEKFDEFSKTLGSKNDPILLISDRMDRLMDIAEKLPKTLKSIENLEQEIKKELADEVQIRGKGEKGINEDAGTARTATLGNPMDLYK